MAVNRPMALTAVALISHDMNREAPPSCLDIKQVNPSDAAGRSNDSNGEWPRHRPSKAKASARTAPAAQNRADSASGPAIEAITVSCKKFPMRVSRTIL